LVFFENFRIKKKKKKQAGAELCQAQFMMGLALQDLQAFPS
jgi:hypothetical protein